MDISALKRNPEAIKIALKKTSDKQLIAKEPCKIYSPVKYEEQKLITFGADTYILGYFCIVVNNQYGVSMAPTMVKITPDSTNIVTMDDDQYYEFSFDKGSPVIDNTDCIKDATILYTVYNEFIAKGFIPWYFTYQDLGELFALAKKYTGTRLGANHVITEMIIATISRNPDNLKQHYRHYVSNYKDIIDNPPHVVKLNSVTYGATNTTAKLIGAYWEEGVTSALVNPSEKREAIEDILRR